MKLKLKEKPKDDNCLYNLYGILEVNKEYYAFGLLCPRDSKSTIENTYVCIADDRYETMDLLQSEPYPVWLPLKNFEVVDANLPDDWVLSIWKGMAAYLLSFPEWIEGKDYGFYFWLVDGRKKELEVFAKYYKKYTESSDS